MQMTERTVAEVTILDLAGNFSSPKDVTDFVAKVKGLIGKGQCLIIVHLGRATHMNQWALQEVLELSQACTFSGGAMKLVSMSEELKRSHFIQSTLVALNYYETEEEALGSFAVLLHNK